ncbi:MAG: hypothetical protein AAF533_19885 [Acidobacteriota bacterium]
MRRPSLAEARRGSVLAEYVKGSGVHAIVVYPWRRDLRLCLGRREPKGRWARPHLEHGGQLVKSGGWWYAQHTTSTLRRFTIQHVLYHEVGHHVDRLSQRSRSRAKTHRTEEFADQFAILCRKTGTHVINRLERATSGP